MSNSEKLSFGAVLYFVTVLRGYVCCYVRKSLFSSVFVITERRDIGLYEVALSMHLLGFGMGTMLISICVVLC